LEGRWRQGRQRAVVAMLAHERGQVRLGAEQPVEVALDQRVELADVFAGGVFAGGAGGARRMAEHEECKDEGSQHTHERGRIRSRSTSPASCRWGAWRRGAAPRPSRWSGADRANTGTAS